ncbi:hypothetical protein CANARDRAFT_29050 [[Candida] arabinofermentans NRRL YB-2248]|uniref:Uncharacterized protein n=1 Tax=[Candida] arabinofermentans NRRL YB-2248 TaxID=983967 RepID=A0A1E4SYD5_9ASCO|nr:hypothetical protein CANARDRAFT_29050 [[Candida] arabinofermentans NRRL YB-2248]
MPTVVDLNRHFNTKELNDDDNDDNNDNNTIIKKKHKQQNFKIVKNKDGSIEKYSQKITTSITKTSIKPNNNDNGGNDHLLSPNSNFGSKLKDYQYYNNGVRFPNIEYGLQKRHELELRDRLQQRELDELNDMDNQARLRNKSRLESYITSPQPVSAQQQPAILKDKSNSKPTTTSTSTSTSTNNNLAIESLIHEILNYMLSTPPFQLTQSVSKYLNTLFKEVKKKIQKSKPQNNDLKAKLYFIISLELIIVLTYIIIINKIMNLIDNNSIIKGIYNLFYGGWGSSSSSPSFHILCTLGILFLFLKFVFSLLSILIV